MKFPFVGPAYQSRSSAVNAQRCVNLYPEVDQTGKNVLALYGTPGLRLLGTAGSGPIRGMMPADGYLVVVSGLAVMKVTSGWSATAIGTVRDTGSLAMASNRTQMIIVDGVDGYIVTLSSGTMAQITDTDFPTRPTQAAFIDSYLIVNSEGTDQFYISNLDDGTSWDGTDFASAEGNPDDIVAIAANNRELWIFGEKTTEVWYDSGDADFPFERINGSFMETGCAAPKSVAKADNSLFWIGTDANGHGIVFGARGYTPQRLSNHAIEHAIQGYGKIRDAIGFCYQQDGHTFYFLTFPTANATWVLDVSNGLWHERAYMDQSTGELHRHRANCHAFFDREHVVGDRSNGKLYAFDLDTYTDNGDYIKALRSCAPVWDGNDRNKVFHARLEIDIEAGVGLQSGQGSSPQMLLRWSDDGAKTWSNEHWVSLGAVGKYSARAVWRRLGSSRNRVYEASITDPVKRVIINGHLQVSPGEN